MYLVFSLSTSFRDIFNCKYTADEFELGKGCKKNKAFYSYTSQKRAKEGVVPLMNEKGEMATIDKEKVRTSVTFLAFPQGIPTNIQNYCIANTFLYNNAHR